MQTAARRLSEASQLFPRSCFPCVSRDAGMPLSACLTDAAWCRRVAQSRGHFDFGLTTWDRNLTVSRGQG
jgi:hypothetical protein